MNNSFRTHKAINQKTADLREFSNDLQQNTVFGSGKPVIILEGFDDQEDDLLVGIQRALYLRRCRASLAAATH